MPIAELLLKRELVLHQNQHGVNISYADDVPHYLASEGFHSRLGARPMRRVIESKVREIMRVALLSETAAEGTLEVERVEGEHGVGKLVLRGA